MFRNMRRSRQQLDHAETVKILQSGTTGVLGLTGDGGYPYAVPINYVYEDGKIYFHGAKSGHKYDSIKKQDKVSLCVIEKEDIIKEELTTYFRSVILFGRARILETDEEILHAARVFSLRYNGDRDLVEPEIQKEWNALCCVEISIDHMTGKEAIELTRSRSSKF